MNLAVELGPEKMAKAQTLFVMSVQHTCMQKCLADYKTPTLTQGEGICIDRCVQKYCAANDRLQKMHQGTLSQAAS